MELKNRFLIAVIVPIIFVTSVMISYEILNMSQTLDEESEEKGLILAKIISERSSDDILTENVFSLKTFISDIKRSDSDVFYIFILDEKGNVIASTFEKGFPKNLKSINPVSEGNSIFEFRVENEIIDDIAVPVLKGSLGTVHLGISHKHTEEYVATTIIQTVSFGILILFISITAVLAYFRHLYDKLLK